MVEDLKGKGGGTTKLFLEGSLGNRLTRILFNCYLSKYAEKHPLPDTLKN